MSTTAKQKARLLATSPTIEGIQSMINRFWGSDQYSVNRETLAIEHPDRVPSGFRVTKQGKRYRFECQE